MESEKRFGGKNGRGRYGNEKKWRKKGVGLREGKIGLGPGSIPVI